MCTHRAVPLPNRQERRRQTHCGVSLPRQVGRNIIEGLEKILHRFESSFLRSVNGDAKVGPMLLKQKLD
jgi:hypothetical protein